MRRAIQTILVLVALGCAQPAFAKPNNIVKIFDDVVVEQNMTVRDIVAIGGDVVISGKVEGGVFVIAGDITVKPGAVVMGDIMSLAGEVIRESGAELNGNLTQFRISRLVPALATFFKRGWVVVLVMLSVFVLIGFLGLTVLLMALLPRHMGTIVSVLEASFMSMLGWGFAWTFLTAVLTGFLVISIVGILLIPFEILLIALALIIGYIAAATFLGRNILRSFNKSVHPFIEAIAGIIVLFFIGFLPIIGAVIRTLLLIAGFGAVCMTRFGTQK
jgi:hypothetical protein